MVSALGIHSFQNPGACVSCGQRCISEDVHHGIAYSEQMGTERSTLEKPLLLMLLFFVLTVR